MLKTAPTHFRQSRLVVLVAILAPVAAAVAQFETISSAWCKYIGIGCVFDVYSAPITVSAGGGPNDVCKGKNVPVCIKPTSHSRKFDIQSGKFVASAVQGTYIDGDVKKMQRSASGWLPKSADPKEICVDVFATTDACETKFSVTGRLTAKEYVSLWCRP